VVIVTGGTPPPIAPCGVAMLRVPSFVVCVGPGVSGVCGLDGFLGVTGLTGPDASSPMIASSPLN
jgi:hypothetical protein